MASKKEITEEEKKKERETRERVRAIALKNIKESNLPDLAISYFAQREESGFGKNDNDSVEQFLYAPAINSGAKAYDPESGKEFNVVYNSLLGSRQDDRRYSGQVSEYDIIKTSADIIQKSVMALKVEDVISLIGSSVPVRESYMGRYIADLMESENEEDKKVAQTIIGGYISYITTQGVSKALNQRASEIKGGLEKIVMEEKKAE